MTTLIALERFHVNKMTVEDIKNIFSTHENPVFYVDNIIEEGYYLKLGLISSLCYELKKGIMIFNKKENIIPLLLQKGRFNNIEI